MKYEQYEQLMFDTITIDLPGILVAKFVKQLISEGIATRSKKEVGKIYVKGLELNDKIMVCLNGNRNTIKEFDKFQFLKGYKYSFIYKINSINYENINEYADRINDFKLNNLDKNKIDINIGRPIYWDLDEHLLIKFHKTIDIIDIETGDKTDIRYPILVVIHKQENLLEIRFDRLTHKRDENFYQLGINTIKDWLFSNLEIDMEGYELGEGLAYIAENCKDDVKEEICSLGYPGEKGVIVKYGKDNIMPFIGELEELIKNNVAIFKKNKETLICKDVLENFIFEKKTLSSKHFRELTWLKSPYQGKNEDDKKKLMRIRVIFNYKGFNKDLITFFDSNNNDMERMNYVIKYIYAINSSIE